MLRYLIILILLINSGNIIALDKNYLKSLVDDGAYEEAFDYLNKNKEGTFDYYFYSGIIYKEELNLKKAKENFEKALSYNENDVELCFLYGDLLLKLNELELLGKKLDSWENKGIKDERIYLIKAKYYRKKKNYDKSLTILKDIEKNKSIEEETLKEKVSIYVESGQNDEAVKILNKILTASYSEELKNFAFENLKLLSTVKSRSEFKFYYAFGYDNNVVSEPSDKYYASLISGKDDNVHLLGFSYNYYKPFKDFSLKINYDLGYSAYNHLSEYNYLTNNLSIDGIYRVNKNIYLDAEYNFFYSLLDERSYLIINGFRPGIRFIDSFGKFSLFIRPFIEKKEFILKPANKNEDRDSYRYGGNIEFAYYLNNNFFSIGYQIARDNTDGYNWKANQHNFNFRAYIRPIEKIVTDFYLGYRIDDYRNKHTTFLIERYDKITDFIFTLEYWINNNFSIFGRYLYINSNSNITLYDYQRRVTLLGLQVRF